MNKILLTVPVDMDDMVQKTKIVIRDALSDAIIDYLETKGICVLELAQSDKILNRFVEELAPLVASAILTEDNASK